MDLGLDGKRALVTGSSSGIGIGIAQALAAEGVAVVVHGRNAERAHQRARTVAEFSAAHPPPGVNRRLTVGGLTSRGLAMNPRRVRPGG